MNITTIEELRTLYPQPSERAKDKELRQLDKHATHFIKLSPFLVLSTGSRSGQMDASPRGGEPGFVKVQSPTEILLPDYHGNNRLDSLHNILESQSVGLLFLIPGVNETLRVNGSAKLSADPSLLSLFTTERRAPTLVVSITIEQVYLHCAKALMRSQLWDPTVQIERSSFPTLGQILKDQLGATEEPESQEAMEARYKKVL